MTKILLLDSSSLIYRSYYAMASANLTDSDGNPTGAVYGYLNMLLKLISDLKPTHIVAAFDMKVPTFRKQEYAEYKATRKPMPEDLVKQLPILREMLGVMKIKILEMEGYEADDIIGTVAKRFDVDTYIVTGDRDCFQLIDYNTFVYRTVKGVTDIVRYDEATLREKEGFAEPLQVIDYKAIAGDSSDNIPGCNGIGDKGARDLLARFHDIDGIYENIEEIKGAVKTKLLQNKEMVYISKNLATIFTDVPIECELEDLETKPYANELKALCVKYGFRSIIGRIRGDNSADITPQQEKQQYIQNVSVKNIEGSELAQLLIKHKEHVAVFLGEDVHIAFSESEEYVISSPKTLFDFESQSSPDEILSIIFNSANKKILFNTKSIMHSIRDTGVVIKDFEDIQLMAYLVNSSVSTASPEDVASCVGIMFDNPASALYLLYSHFEKLINDNGLSNLYNQVEKPLIHVLYDMETAGFTVDYQALKDFRNKYNQELKLLTEQIFDLAGETFNINSSQQLSKILYDKLGLNSGRKIKTGYSVAADVLETLEHPIIPLLLDYRRKQKLLSTYIDGMESVLNKKTGKVHTVFKQCLTVTGRLSSTEPNLQNIPVRDEEGREIRKMFVGTDGNLLLSADYSQIELRLLAHFCGDANLVDAYRNGHDIHRETAAKIFGVPLAEVTAHQRTAAKAVNFGIIYGISGFGLAANLKVSLKEAKDFQTKYFENFPRVKEYMNANVEYAHQYGYVKTLLGRIRRLPELTSPNHNLKNFGERAAMNMPLQGTASDIIKIAMINVANALKKEGLSAKLILQVHDELIIDTPEAELERVKALLKREMENSVELSVPLPVEIGVGRTWYDAK